MNKIEIFKNKEFGEIRTVIIDGDPWFVGKDISSALGYGNTNDALKKHVMNEDKLMGSQNATPSIKDTLGRTQYPTWINESGLYSLIFGSKLESAIRFKHWVTSEVLPSIRKYGGYIDGQEKMTDDELLEKAILVAQRKIAERDCIIKKQKEKIEQQKPLVDFANQVSDTTDLIDMKTMAKLLKDSNINIGRNRLFEFLRIKKILMKDNQPYQQYVDAGYFKVNEYTYTDFLGQTKTNRQTLVTGKGQLYITKKVKEFWAG